MFILQIKMKEETLLGKEKNEDNLIVFVVPNTGNISIKNLLWKKNSRKVTVTVQVTLLDYSRMIYF